MGAAIGVFDGARALRVPRRRFAPVKTTNDLLALRSDAYVLTDAGHIEPAPERDGPPLIDLDDAFYKRVGEFERRFPAGAPSLVAGAVPGFVLVIGAAIVFLGVNALLLRRRAATAGGGTPAPS
jgi:hypothetical protein